MKKEGLKWLFILGGAVVGGVLGAGTGADIPEAIDKIKDAATKEKQSSDPDTKAE